MLQSSELGHSPAPSRRLPGQTGPASRAGMVPPPGPTRQCQPVPMVGWHSSTHLGGSMRTNRNPWTDLPAEAPYLARDDRRLITNAVVAKYELKLDHHPVP